MNTVLKDSIPHVRMGYNLTECEVKMAGYWPSSFFRLFKDRDKVEVHKLAKNERGQAIQSSWPNKLRQ